MSMGISANPKSVNIKRPESGEGQHEQPPDTARSDHLAPMTARTDQVLLDMHLEDVDANPSVSADSKQGNVDKVKAEQAAKIDNLTVKHDRKQSTATGAKAVSAAYIFSDVDEISEHGGKQKLSNIGDRNVRAKDHRYVVVRPKNWTENVLTENQ